MYPQQRSPAQRKKTTADVIKIFQKNYSVFRVFAYRVRKPRPRQRNATPPTPEAQARPENGKRQNRAAAQSGKNGYMGNPSMYSTYFSGLERIGKGEKLPLSRSGRA